MRLLPRAAALIAATLAVGVTPATLAFAGAPAASAATTWHPHTVTPEPGAPTTPDPTNPAGCDPIGGWQGVTADNADCMLPFPNDWFTKYDASSATHRRVNFNIAAMPRNREGKPIEPESWNRSDGFSIGSQILVHVPNMTSNKDIAASGLPGDADIGRYADPDSGAVLLDTVTGKRWPVWAEVDQYTGYAGPGPRQGTVEQDLILHPAVNLAEGRRYVVALRHLTDDAGKPVAAPAAFAAYRDGKASAGDRRTPHFEDLFSTLADAGVARSDLYLAWDFTTASAQNTTGRLRAMRDDAFHQLGDDTLADLKVQGDSPAFSVSGTTANPATGIAAEVTGSFTVPCYIAPTCAPTGQFALDPLNPDAVPSQPPGQTYSANFICEVPSVAYGADPVQLRPSLYGHGLFGGAGEVGAGNVRAMAQEHGMLECATDWYGMATTDIPNAIADMADLSRFDTLVDRVQQGELNFMYLARLMIHHQGFCSAAAFQRPDGSCVIDTRRAFYDGNSQGGIYGGVVCALIPDADRCVLGVPGENYAVLLPRSSDYVEDTPLGSQLPDGIPSYSAALDTFYPDQSQRMLVLDLIQMLWDRGDPNGYADHMTTDPLPDTPVHHVLFQMAWGDHQVTNVMAETEARAVGAKLVTPALVPGREGAWVDPFWGLGAVPSFPYDGSALTVFDTGPTRPDGNGGTRGTDPPPLADVPNRSGDDPHEAPRNTVCGRQQKSDFLSVGGVVTSPCGGGPYLADGWNGVDGLTPGTDVPEAPLPALLGGFAVAAVAAVSLRRRRRA